MRRPGFWIIVGLLLVAAGAVTGWTGLWLGKGVMVWEDRLRAFHAIASFGTFALFGGLILAGIGYAVWRKREALRSGTGLVARWRIGMLEWAAFRRRDEARGGLFHSLRNRLRLPEELPPEGVEIRVGNDALLVGDDCYGLGYFASRGKLVDVARVDGAPVMLEFATYQQSKNSARLVVFRVPAPASARAEVQTVLDHFAQTIDPQRRDKALRYFATHFQAATGDAGEVEAARAAHRERNWRGFGMTGLFLGGAILVFALTSARGLNATPTALTLYIAGGAILAVAGAAILLLSFMARR